MSTHFMGHFLTYFDDNNITQLVSKQDNNYLWKLLNLYYSRYARIMHFKTPTSFLPRRGIFRRIIMILIRKINYFLNIFLHTFAQYYPGCTKETQHSRVHKKT